MLITCPDCKNKVSNEAESCPHCGYVEPGAWSRELRQACEDEISEWESRRGQQLILGTYANISHCTQWPATFIGSPTRAELTSILGWSVERFARCSNCGQELHIREVYGSSTLGRYTGGTGPTCDSRPRGRAFDDPSAANLGWLWALFIILILAYPAAQIIHKMFGIF